MVFSSVFAETFLTASNSEGLLCSGSAAADSLLSDSPLSFSEAFAETEGSGTEFTAVFTAGSLSSRLLFVHIPEIDGLL